MFLRTPASFSPRTDSSFRLGTASFAVYRQGLREHEGKSPGYWLTERAPFDSAQGRLFRKPRKVRQPQFCGSVGRKIRAGPAPFRHYACGEVGVVEIESQWTARIRERAGIFPTLKLRA